MRAVESSVLVGTFDRTITTGKTGGQKLLSGLVGKKCL
jgi:hypothetical protein